MKMIVPMPPSRPPPNSLNESGLNVDIREAPVMTEPRILITEFTMKMKSANHQNSERVALPWNDAYF